jgi:3-hydroxyacyl-CoA dehydrogenase/enoyl-CoA hydratase/3-hydroxybutyryl-CoA epimerase
MLAGAPALEQFRLEAGSAGIVHFVFDAPGRSMNVFSNAAIHELGRFAAWLRGAGVRGVVVRSGKPSAFCAGADLSELGVAYDMIMAAQPGDRFRIAFDHFFPLSQAIRALETAGKPVAAAVAGLALGGGCELALGAHHRVLADAPNAAFGLPESLVGLLPGGGGTQRLPRLTGLEAALPILLEGARLGGEAAITAGLADSLVTPGSEVEAAERWIVDVGQTVQPWDRPEFPRRDVAVAIAAERRKILAATHGHYPAPLAILDCLEQGLPQDIEPALRTEMEIFARLIQRPEARNMIQTLFNGKLDHERLRREGGDPAVEAAVRDILALRPESPEAELALAVAGFARHPTSEPVQATTGPTYWIDSPPFDPRKELAKQHIVALRGIAARHPLDDRQRRAVDYRLAQEGAYPPYLESVFNAGAGST